MGGMRVVFLGTPEFAVPTLEALLESSHEVLAVVARPDRPAGRGMKLHSPATAQLAQSRGVRLMQPERIRDPQFLDAIRGLKPEAGIVVAYGKILPESLLTIPARGFLNVHASLLPRYRGAAPIQRAIERGETETGVTIMKVDTELDHGPILTTASLPIGRDERAPSLSRRLAELGGRELVAVLDRIDQLEPHEQQHDEATHAPKIEKDEGRIDWSGSAASIYNKFRAFDPWPGLFTTVAGQTLKLTAVAPGDAAGDPGTILAIRNDGLLVATGEGALEVSQVQRPGGRPIDAVTFARSVGLREGARFS